MLTDARHFTRLIHTFGFLPMRLPPEFRIMDTIHVADERLPVEAPGFGAQTILAVITRTG